jgi:hypothetical protein
MEKDLKEQMKLNEKSQKHEQGIEKFEGWVRRQAEQDEIKSLIKKDQEQREKEEKIKKQMYEEQKKIVANNAFRLWAENKGKTNKSKINRRDIPTTQGTQKSRERAFKVPIGPYTNAKGLREIQKKLNNLNSSEMEMEMEMYNENEDIQEIDEGQMYDQDFQKNSIHDISSINKEPHTKEDEI